MRELRLVAMSDDGTHLILHVDGEESPLTLPIDERLHAALRGDRARLGQLEIQLDSQLRPRDIQARVRAGDSVEAVAAAARVPLDRVLRFARPVLAERQHVAERARAAVIRRASGENMARSASDVIAARVAAAGCDPESITWDAWRRDDGRWQVSAVWVAGQDNRRALFTFDPTGRSVQPDDEEARAVAGERRREPEPDERTPEPGPDPQQAPGPARLSVVPRGGAGISDEPHPDALVNSTNGSPTPIDRATPQPPADPDDEPTVPVPVVPRHDPGARGHEAANTSGEESDRLRLADIATRVETDDGPPTRPAAEADSQQPARDRRTRRTGGSSRNRRPSVPSWDEIMFGRRRPE